MERKPSTQQTNYSLKLHIVARLIAHHVHTGSNSLFIYPVFTSFDFMWMLEDYPGGRCYVRSKQVAQMILDSWPEDRLENFTVWPIFRLLAKLEAPEQLDVLEILRTFYGFTRFPE